MGGGGEGSDVAPAQSCDVAASLRAAVLPEYPAHTPQNSDEKKTKVLIDPCLLKTALEYVLS
jgi:hypothetical protein